MSSSQHSLQTPRRGRFLKSLTLRAPWWLQSLLTHAKLPVAASDVNSCFTRIRQKASIFVLIPALTLGLGTASHAANIIHEFYVPMPEDQIRTALRTIEPGAGVVGTTMESVISIVITGAGSVIHYDEWEDGYEIDLNNPSLVCEYFNHIVADISFPVGSKVPARRVRCNGWRSPTIRSTW